MAVLGTCSQGVKVAVNQLGMLHCARGPLVVKDMKRGLLLNEMKRILLKNFEMIHSFSPFLSFLL